MAVQPERLHNPERGCRWNARRIDKRPEQSGTDASRLRSLVHASIKARPLRADGGQMSAASSPVSVTCDRREAFPLNRRGCFRL